MFKLSLLLTASLLSPLIQAQTFTIEELRLDKAQKVLPALKHKNHQVDTDMALLLKNGGFTQVVDNLRAYAEQLWSNEKKAVQLGALDDRALYWQRLAGTKAIKQHGLSFSASQRDALIEVFEAASRGRTELAYSKGATKKILLTGFDPFLLDKNIAQSNPSGIAALLLDGQVIEYKGITAEINTVMIPVRYEDFDHGEIESLLAPFYATESVDLIATISMGREHFDLEHFPGKRRSVTAPDNLNVVTGANESNPIIPLLGNLPLSGPEFVSYSLPYSAMTQASGEYKVIDNREVVILQQPENKKFAAQSLSELEHATAVKGGGGGYLSNEISYRSIRLRNLLGSQIPTGHIHTPRIIGFDEKANLAVTAQIKEMLRLSLTEI